MSRRALLVFGAMLGSSCGRATSPEPLDPSPPAPTRAQVPDRGSAAPLKPPASSPDAAPPPPGAQSEAAGAGPDGDADRLVPRDRVVPPGAPDAAAAEPSGAPDAAAPESPSTGDAAAPAALLERELLGYWQTERQVGDCIDTLGLLHFMPAGAAESIRVDNDACDPAARGAFVSAATYALAGRTLTLNESGSRSRFAIAVSHGLTSRRLRREVFLPDGALAWQNEVSLESLAQDGTLLARTTLSVRLGFGAALPRAGSGPCSASVAYGIELFALTDSAGAPLPPDAQTRRFEGGGAELPCSYAPGGLGQRIDVIGVPAGGLDAAALAALRMALGGRTVGASFDSELWLDPDQPDHLFALPELMEATAPPGALTRQAPCPAASAFRVR